MRLRFVAPVILCATGLAAGCSAFGAADNSAPPEATPSRTDEDASRPAASASRFCGDSSARLCVDFDGEPVGAWASGGLAPRDVEMRDGSVAVAATSVEGAALLAMLPPSGPSGGSTLGMKAIVLPSGTGMEIEADVMIEMPADTYPTSGTSVAMMALEFGTDAVAWALFSGNPAHPTAYCAVGNGEPAVRLGAATLPYNSWFHLRFRADVIGIGDGGVEVAFGDAGSTTAAFIQRGATSGGVTTLFIGAARYDPNRIPTAVTVHIDNVTANPH